MSAELLIANTLRIAREAGQYYEAKLTGILADIDALPAALTGGTPLAEELAALETDHDGYGGAIYFTTDVYLRLNGRG